MVYQFNKLFYLLHAILFSALCLDFSNRDEIVIKRLFPDINLSTWYQEKTSYIPSDAFGCYVMHSMDGTVYLGFGTSLPTAMDGALLAKIEKKKDNSYNLVAIDRLHEQGLHDITSYDGVLYIAGTDPTASHELGNIYIYKPNGKVIRKRTLPNVAHTFGVWIEGDTIYASTCNHEKDQWKAALLKSADHGDSWTTLSYPGNMWGIDIIGLNGYLYLTKTDAGRKNCQLLRSKDKGLTWNTVVSTDSLPLQRLLIFNNYIVFSQAKRAKDGQKNKYEYYLHLLNEDEHEIFNITKLNFKFNYNCISSSDKSFLYAITKRNKVLRVKIDNKLKLKHNIIADFNKVKEFTKGERLLSLAVNPIEESLLVASGGTRNDKSEGNKAKLWKITFVRTESIKLK